MRRHAFDQTGGKFKLSLARAIARGAGSSQANECGQCARTGFVRSGVARRDVLQMLDRLPRARQCFKALGVNRVEGNMKVTRRGVDSGSTSGIGASRVSSFRGLQFFFVFG